MPSQSQMKLPTPVVIHTPLFSQGNVQHGFAGKEQTNIHIITWKDYINKTLSTELHMIRVHDYVMTFIMYFIKIILKKM